MKKYRKKLFFIFFISFLVTLAPHLFGAEDQRRYVPPPVTRVNIPKPVDEIQRELQHIMQIQQTLKLQQINKLAEMQRIAEQARIHQQLLSNLTTPPSVTPHTRDVNEALRLQKIALIQEQAKVNRVILEGIQREVGGGGGGGVVTPAEKSITPEEKKSQKEQSGKTTQTSAAGKLEKAPFSWQNLFQKPTPSTKSSASAPATKATPSPTSIGIASTSKAKEPEGQRISIFDFKKPKPAPSSTQSAKISKEKSSS